MSETPTRVILLACGSFNPVTHMHLRIFEISRDYLNRTGRYNVVDGIISPVNDRYKKKDLIPSIHRAAMLQMALSTSDWIRLDTWESEQIEWSPTVKVLRHHSEERNNNQQMGNQLDNSNTNTEPVKVMLICGSDVLETFSIPGLWKDEDKEEIVSRFGIVVIARENTNPRRFIYESDLLTKYQNNIHIVTEWITNDVSSTKIRTALRRGESVKYLIPDDVITYIQQNNLYKDPCSTSNKYRSSIFPPSHSSCKSNSRIWPSQSVKSQHTDREIENPKKRMRYEEDSNSSTDSDSTAV